jgi:hypothetical protein
VGFVISMITTQGYRIEKTRQIDCHSVGRDRLGALIAVSYSIEPEQLPGRQRPNKLVWARFDYTERTAT